MDLGLRDKACIVTGATRGIGLAVAQMLRAEGAEVLCVGRDEAALRQVQADTGARHLVADVTHTGAAQRIIGRCRDEFGRIDVLVNNAGTSFACPLDKLEDADWQSQWDLHVMAPVRLMRLVAPMMAAARGGRIVTVASAAGRSPSQTNAAYSVTKAAQLSLSRAYSDAYAAQNVLINAVTPGAVSSPLWIAEGGLGDQLAAVGGGDRAQMIERAAAGSSLGRLGTVEEVAAVVVFLCSELASNVTGSAWAIDGGTVPTIF